MADTSASHAYNLLVRHRRLLIGTCAAAVAGYGAYKVYNSETVRTLRKLQVALSNYSDAVASASSATSLLFSDLEKFLSSEEEEVPRSLKQACRLLQSPELQNSLSDTVSTVVRSIAAANNAASADSTEPSLTDKLIDAVFSPRGHSLLGMAIGVASKNVTGTFCEYLERVQNSPSSSEYSPTAILSLLASEQGEKFLSVLITMSIKTAVFSYVDAYRGYNMYDDMVASITKQTHRDAVTDIMTRITSAFCREVASLYRKSKAAPANSHSMRRSFSGTDSIVVCGHERSESGVPTAGADVAASKSKQCARVNSGASAGSRTSFDSMAEVGVPVKLNSRPTVPPSSVWINDVVCLLKDRNVRALAVDVVSSATREATRGTVETLLGSVMTSKQDGVIMTTSSSLAMCKVYAVMSMSVALMLYAMSPRTMVL